VCTMEKANITINRLMAEGRLGAPEGCARSSTTRCAQISACLLLGTGRLLSRKQCAS